MSITIQLNGKKEEVKDGMSISELLSIKNIRPEVVTVELNDVIIKKSEYERTFLKSGDRMEYVYYMGALK